MKIPSHIVLPARSQIAGQELRKELDISRMTLNNWTHKHQFPKPARMIGVRAFYNTVEIATWLRERGCSVRIV